MQIKKSYFTLLELLIVLFIISFGVILTGIKVSDLYREQRFLSDTQQVLSQLVMAQDLMLIMDADVQVKFAPDEKTKKINVWLEIEKPLEKSKARVVERKLSLATIGSLQFQEQTLNELTLEFSLGRMSKGKLILFEEEERKTRHAKKREFEIELLGYPSPIGVKSPGLDEQKKQGRSELLYPVEIYEELYKDPNKNNSIL
jgi:type II secretory pathway pseudopilin PulG